ncbi:MAG TPA: hypothetical protein P5205_08605 [Candidatus Paceibacterota bacterium]|nr:hypothetical protein [Verrucomicrobiota bacterium]HSA10418.1 hypothetical protein [Candidatus Paceibacterota bacterium]
MSADDNRPSQGGATAPGPEARRFFVGLWGLWILLLSACAAPSCLATGVTLITHGFNSDADDWVRGMADSIPSNIRFPGTQFTTYKIILTSDGNYQCSRASGNAPTLTDSGEIIVRLDWSQMAGTLFPPSGGSSTYYVAQIASQVLQDANAISELGGHALAEFPLHLAGHSRGGSLINEITRLLGTNGLWVDHLSSLDPHPLNNDGNNDWLFATVDASASSTFANVLFRDNYWQGLGDNLFVPNGKPASGAYNRELTILSEGYDNPHSNVHLWYHGTLDWRTPTSDGSASITSDERISWWVAYEDQGVVAGFNCSLIGGADRLSPDQPLGPGFPAIQDGYNQYWDLGLGTAANRTALPANNGTWPNLIKFNRVDTNAVVQGQSLWIKFYYQWARPNTTNATVSFYLDDDFNPLNFNQKFLKQISVPGNGASFVSYANASLTLDPTNAAPGYHALYASITGGGLTRHLYAPELVELVPSPQPPTLDIWKVSESRYRIAVNAQPGQNIVLENSTDLQTWSALATNSIETPPWLYTNSPPSSPNQRFYRAVLSP